MNDWEKVFPDTLGGRLKKTLRQLDINQRQFTDRIGMASTTFSQIIANKSQPKIDKLYIIAKALGVSMEWLIDGDLNLLSRWQRQKLQEQFGEDGYDRLFKDFYKGKKEASKYIIRELNGSNIIDQSNVQSMDGGGVHATIDAGTVKVGGPVVVDQGNIKEGSLTIEAGVEFPFPLALLDDPAFVSAVKSIAMLNSKQRTKLVQIINTMFDLDT